MKISDLFANDVTRNIPPVVYFHEQSPDKVSDEVNEYIITGGYPESDPRHRRVPEGIHDQYVKLLNALAAELRKKPGPELPASWISGFYGSGKSSFAKLLGLALDGHQLPDGRSVAEALLARDDSPKRQELRDAWSGLTERLQPVAVVFDIGGEARDGEQIHSAAQRVIQRRLGYSTNPLVADAELKLEHDGEWDAFQKAAKRVLGKDWEQFRTQRRVDEHFSHVMSELEHSRYPEPMSWLDSRAGTKFHEGAGVSETVKNIEAMLERRAKGKTLFVVIDEVSQYVHQNEDRMLKLQSFVSELGQRLKGRVWLIATGQQKLEDTSTSHALGKLKDRFPPALRVHLATTNIRDVVHRRLLKKDPAHEKALRDSFSEHGAQLKLYGFDCSQLAEEDFVEVYPMLPGHVDLLMQLTTSLRVRSSRTQGDDYAIRGLLQLLGELFREKRLADRPLGDLVTLDVIYDVQHTALESDVQATMNRVLAHPGLIGDAWALKAAKAVALLELNNEQRKVTDELVAACLYPQLGAPNPLNLVKPALEKLLDLSLVGYSEKEGYKIQSSAGQEWQRERDELGVSVDERSRLVREKLAELMKDPERPRLKGRAFYWSALYSDGRQARDERLLSAQDEASVTLDFRCLSNKKDRSHEEWVKRSDEAQLKDRIVWVAGDEELVEVLKALHQSRHIVGKYEPRKASLTSDKKRLLIEEQDRQDTLEGKARDAVQQAFVDGDLYFRGQHQPAKEAGATFKTAMSQAGTARLPQLYPHHTDVAVMPRELEELLASTLSGVSPSLLDGGLGLLQQDGGRYIPTCQGQVPSVILGFIEKGDGTAGNVLLQEFSRPPYGFPPDVVRACLAALVRAHKVKIKTEDGNTISSVADPGAREVFLQATRFKRCEILPNRDASITPRDLTAMRRFFETLHVDVEPTSDALADAVFKHFAPLRERLRMLEERYTRLPDAPSVEEPLVKLGRALEACRSSRNIDETVKAVKRELPVLQEGTQLLQRLTTDLTDEGIYALRQVAETRDVHLKQLVAEGSASSVVDQGKQLEAQLDLRRPWVEVASVIPAVEAIRTLYQTRRQQLLGQQEQQAEAVRGRLRLRPGVERLTHEELHQVFKPIAMALSGSGADAVAPPLLDLRDGFIARLQQATTEAESLLDDLISSKDNKPFVRVDLNLRGREIANSDDLKRVVKELEERVTEQLELGHKVRLA